jgi:glyoxylase-like metal-dependent hydrolase (beta-lactamase superfamily II)
MAGNTLTVGNVDIVALTDAEVKFPMSLDQLFPNMPGDRWGPYQQRYPAAFEGPDAAHIHFGGYLVRSHGKTILVNTGIGPDPKPLFDHQPGQMMEDLRRKGGRPEDVDMVLHTHLHPDHVGWNLTRDGKPTFPKARYLVHQDDWDTFHRPEVQAAFPFPYVGQTISPLRELGVLDLLDGERALTEELTAIHTPGHTPGHMSLLVSSAGEKAILLGDAMGNPAQVTEPDIVFAFDGDPQTALATRKALLDRVEAEGMRLVQCHFPTPGWGTIVRLEGRRYFQAL